MTTLTFKQTGTPGEYLQAGCSSLDLPDPNVTNHLATVGGSGSATQHTRTVTGSDTGADSEVMLAGWIAYPGNLWGDTWEAGDWICRLQVTAANSAVQWSSVYICAKVGSDWTTIASKTDVNALLASTGTKTATLTTGSATDMSGAASSPYVYWFYGFTKSTSGEQTFKYRSNKNLASPIVAKVNAPVVTLTGTSIAPTLGLAAPVVSLAGSAASPGLGIAGPVVSLTGSGLSPGLGMAVPAVTLAGTAASSTLGFGLPSLVLSGSAVTPPVLLPSEVKAPPRSRIASSGIEIGAGVATAVPAARYAGSAAAVGASSSSTLAASRSSWSGQHIGAIPYCALVAGRAFSSQQRLAAIGSPDPVVSRSIQTSAVQGGVGSSGVVAAAISSCGVEFGGVSCAD